MTTTKHNSVLIKLCGIHFNHSLCSLSRGLTMAAISFPPPPPLSRFLGDKQPLPALLRPMRIQQVSVPRRVSAGGNRAPPGVDTRIHWDNEDEGWVGGNASDSRFDAEKQQQSLLAEKFSDLLNDSSGSHYQFLGVAADADLEEIKSAYRRLSKEYHPDTTTLPLKAASDKFMKLREIYDVLSDEERRRFYDWTLAQEAASRQADKLRIRLQDPYVRQVETYEPVPDMVDRLGGKNMELSDQAMSALTFDIVVIFFCVCCIVYALFFKEY